MYTYTVPCICSVLAWWWMFYSRNMKSWCNWYFITVLMSICCVLDGNIYIYIYIYMYVRFQTKQLLHADFFGEKVFPCCHIMFLFDYYFWMPEHKMLNFHSLFSCISDTLDAFLATVICLHLLFFSPQCLQNRLRFCHIMCWYTYSLQLFQITSAPSTVHEVSSLIQMLHVVIVHSTKSITLSKPHIFQASKW